MTAKDCADPKSPRVLIVDDDAELLELLGEVLRRAGYRVDATHSAEAALGLVRDFGFDLAICDRHLPGMDGIDLLEQLRQRQPMCARMLLTGGLDLKTTLSAVNRGAVGRVIEKPVRTAVLRTIVAEAIEGQRRMVEAYETMQHASLEAERERLEHALAGEYLRIAVQPILAASDDSVHGFEALLRSTHPDFAGPQQLVAAAERHGMVDRLAERVTRLAAGWLECDDTEARLFVNLHPEELGEPSLLDARLQQLAPWAPRVVLEITERGSIYGVPAWEQSIALIRARGFQVAVDDLGAGYSALAVLAELQPDYIKVDMSIIRDCDSNPHKRRLADLLCRFADATDALLVAEGVETPAEAATMKACGAHLLQGYFFGRPRLSEAALPSSS